MFYRLWLETILWPLWFVRRFISVDSRLYLILSSRSLQPFLAYVGRLRAHAAFIKARDTCPAYRDFLIKADYREKSPWRLKDVPVMGKENYIRAYSLEQRCYGGRIPAKGVVIDESSGSTGLPNNWVRSPAERCDLRRILQLNYQLIYGRSETVLLNCFALGPWATGMNISMSLVDVGILKSIGPDVRKIDNTLELLGPHYRYVIFGYPPFLRSFVDETRLDLQNYHLDFIIGGEGMSEGLRAYLLKSAKTVISSYGASDLEINIGIETSLAIALRQLCLRRKELSKLLFGRETPPMIFQYNALDYIIETNEEQELLFTIGRQSGAAPKIRYNLRDRGGVYTFAEMSSLLKGEDVDLSKLVPRFSHFPFLFVFGRNDASVPFYGAKIFPSDIEQIISDNPVLANGVNSFQLKISEDENFVSHLQIHLERRRASDPGLNENELNRVLFDGLVQVNQDFREVTKMFDPEQVRVFVHEYESGPFAGRDLRIKNKYIA